MSLAQLLGTIPLNLFMDEYFLKLPFALSGGCKSIAHLGSWSMMEHLLGQQGADVLVGNQSGQWSGSLPSSGAEARALLDGGYTVAVRHAEAHHPALAELAADFNRDLTGAVDVQLYCTPAGFPGFGWHYDPEDVFILQTHGSKQWCLRKNTVNPWPLIESLPENMRYEAEIMPLVRCLLKAGDWLYIPGGYWHRTAAEEESYSLSVGIQSPTGIDFFDFLRGRLLDSLRWRQRLPPPKAYATRGEDALLAAYAAHLAELSDDLQRMLSQEELARQFLAAGGRPPSKQSGEPRGA